jgi:hypothetical protein
VVRLEKGVQNGVFFGIFVYLVPGHGLGVFQVVLNVAVVGPEAEGFLVVENGESQFSAPEIGVPKIVEKVSIVDAAVGTTPPFVNGPFEIAFVVGFGTCFETCTGFRSI